MFILLFVIAVALIVLAVLNEDLAYGFGILGGRDWNLCCDIKHPTPKEKEMGKTFYFGHLCYKNTDACDMYEPKGD